jgi:serine/threonine protein kinase
MDNPIIHKYIILNLIGNGKFGVVYKGQNRKSREYVAIKMEPCEGEYSILKHESTILHYLYSKSCRNIPAIYWYGQFLQEYKALVIPFYTTTLSNYIQTHCHTERSRNQIMKSAIRILENIHKNYVVHRDMKPDNWMIREDDSKELVLIDFGLADFYVDENERHISYTGKKEHIVGTPKYVSWNVHCGSEYSRRDDLISLAYIGLYMAFPEQFCVIEPARLDSVATLPTTHIESKVNVGWKTAKYIDTILSYSHTWQALTDYIQKVYSLSFFETPNYSSLANLFIK